MENSSPAGVKKKKIRWARYLPLILMMLPGIAYLFINNYLPMFGITIAFKKLDYAKGILRSDWVGLQNFKFFFMTKDFGLMVRNTIGYNIIFIFGGLVIHLAIAVMMTEIGQMKIAKVIQPVICFPNMVSIIIVAYLVYAFLGSDGFVNHTILNGNGIGWYKEAKYWPFILPIVHFWKGAGYGSIIYIATMSGIDKSLYEAARLDGATKWQQITKITLPIIRPMIMLMMIVSIGRIFNSDFGLFLQVPMNSGALYKVTQTFDTYVYRALMQNNDVSMSSAASVFQAIIGFVLVMTTNLIVRKINPESAIF